MDDANREHLDAPLTLGTFGLIPLDDVGALVGEIAGARPVITETVRRWIVRGVGDQQARLPAIKIGTGWYTTRELVEAFVRENRPALRLLRRSGNFNRRTPEAVDANPAGLACSTR